MDLYKYTFKIKKILSFGFIFLLSCTTSVENPLIESISINWITADYNQIEKKLFLQLEIQSWEENIDSVIVEINSDNYNLIVILNDNGNNGDIIPNNNRYSVNTDVELPYGNILLNAIIYSSSSIKYEYKNNILIEEQFPPEIIDFIFWKKYADGSGMIFDPSSEVYKVDNNDYTFLDFQLIINDKNGIDDIKHIYYEINVENMFAVDSCQYIPEFGFLSYPQWYLEYKETIEDGFIFDVNNIFLEEPGIPIKPIQSCGRIGVSVFKFIVSDMTFDPITTEISIGFDK